ncbi:MAG: fasciclin domain-containing protein, partial [Bacteroidota bacterium]|nr:fasciclin domain-containing protein [Bacteroidota bacterium]
MKKIIVFSLFILLISMHSCSKDQNEPQIVIQKTIFEHVRSNLDYSYLKDALEITDLDDVLNEDGDYTLYAPNNSAFIGFLMRRGYSTLDEVPIEVLKKILNNH